MRQTVSLGRLFDIRVGVHVSWFLVYAFTTASLASTIVDVGRPAAIGLAAVCAAFLFVSVVAHEFAHALVARRFGIRTRAITLFLFGGVALLENEPATPWADVVIALAGPAMSALLGALAFGLLALVERVTSGSVGHALSLLVAYLALANGVLALFNLIPAFPMDGGRVVRAAIWRARRSRAAATGAASILGLVLASAVIIAGVVSLVTTHRWQAVWYVLIGMFLARQGWVQLHDSRYVERLERVRVSDVMEAAAGDHVPADGVSLASSSSALDAIRLFRTTDRTDIAVVDAGELAGWLRRERMLAIFDRAA
jgi:Zn-dependent protease